MVRLSVSHNIATRTVHTVVARILKLSEEADSEFTRPCGAGTV
jgi:hypothetical protein